LISKLSQKIKDQTEKRELKEKLKLFIKEGLNNSCLFDGIEFLKPDSKPYQNSGSKTLSSVG
jgi:hypothetical protein